MMQLTWTASVLLILKRSWPANHSQLPRFTRCNYVRSCGAIRRFEPGGPCYARDAQGIPGAWVARVRESMASLTPLYSANRSVRQYVEQCYLPAAEAYRRRAADQGALGAQIAARLRLLEQGWPTLRFGRVSVDTRDGRHHFSVQVQLGALAPQAVRVQLYADASPGAELLPVEMTRTAGAPGAAQTELYVASVPAGRAPSDYTARIVPELPGCMPLEAAAHILWQR